MQLLLSSSYRRLLSFLHERFFNNWLLTFILLFIDQNNIMCLIVPPNICTSTTLAVFYPTHIAFYLNFYIITWIVGPNDMYLTLANGLKMDAISLFLAS